MQLIEAPTDIEVNRAGVPIVAGEMGPDVLVPESKTLDELKRDIKDPLKSLKKSINTFLGQNKKSIYIPLSVLSTLATQYEFKSDEEGGATDADKRTMYVNYLKNNASFISDFGREYNSSKVNLSSQQQGKVKKPEIYKATLGSLLSKSGNGKRSLMTGLYNDQIDDMLRHEPKYFGCISRDEIHKLQLDDNGKYGFVYNTVPSNKPTKYDGHWRAIYIDLDDGKSIDHYDSFGEPAEEDIQNQIGTLLKPFNLPYYLKWKDNKIVNQRSNSSNCGFFCVNFLQDRFEGIPFVDSTGYSNANKAEKDLKKKFGYLIVP